MQANLIRAPVVRRCRWKWWPGAAFPGRGTRCWASSTPLRSGERSLVHPQPLNKAPPWTAQWGILRMALPFVHRMLPLLDGNIGTVVSNLLTPHPQPPPQHQSVDLEPLEKGLADLRPAPGPSQCRHRTEFVIEARGRPVGNGPRSHRPHTLEQQELLEDLKNVGNKINAFAFLALALWPCRFS